MFLSLGLHQILQPKHLMIPKRVTNLIICFHGLLVHCTTLITLWVGWIFCIHVGEHRFITVNFIPSPLVNKLIKAKSEIWSITINLCTYLCTCRSPIRNVTSDVRAHTSIKFSQHEIWVQDWGKELQFHMGRMFNILFRYRQSDLSQRTCTHLK